VSRSRLVLWVAVALPVLAAFAPRDLWAPDEPRYGLVARTILETGDALVPRINGEPYAEKPPLVFAAMAALGALVGGVTAVVARLACALFAAVAVLTTARLARRWFRDEGLGDTAALLFATTGLVAWNGARAGLDLPMTCFALLALEAGTVLVARRAVGAACALGAALGAGLLVKGPHVFYVPVAALVGGTLAAGEGRRWRDPRWLLALVVALGLAAAWFVPASARAGDAPAYNSDLPFGRRILGQIGSRATGEDEPHAHGPLYLLPLLLAFGLPWTPVWLFGLARALRPSRVPAADRFGVGAAVAGLLGPLLLLSLPTSKRELYLIPLFPCAAILGAYTLHRLVTPRAAVHLVRGFVVVGAGLALAAVAAPFVAPSMASRVDVDDRAAIASVGEPRVVFALVAAAVVAAAGALAAWRLRERPVGAARATGLAVGAAGLVFAIAVLPAFDRWKSFDAAAAAGAAARPDADLAIWGFSDRSVLWWFPHRRLDHLGVHTYAEAAAALAPDAPPRLVLAKAKNYRERTRRASPAERALLDGARVVWEGPVGGTSFVLLTNAGK